MSLTAADITDLRTALKLLDQHGELAQTDVEADPVAELCGAYRHIGAGGTVARPHRPGHAFNKVRHPGARVAIGVLSSRKRAALLLGTEPERLGWHLMDALQHLIQPTAIKGIAPCQEAVHRADEPGFDLRRLVPAPTNTPEDAGPYVTMGLLYGKDPENGDEDVTIIACACRPRVPVRLVLAGPPHRRVPRQGRGRGQASARVRQHRA
ncbi:MAG: UbiD family decarboxylase domain-containing protein [Bilophila wadsworthia]